MVWKLTGDGFGLNARMAPLTMLFTALFFLVTLHPALAENQKKQDRKDAWEALHQDLDYGDLTVPPQPKVVDPVEKEDKTEINWQFNRSVVGSIVLGIVVLALVTLLIYLIIRHYNAADTRLDQPSNLEYSLEALDASMPETDLERHLRLAIARNDYRGAVRVYYIIALRKLDEAQLIEWQIDKTNQTYLFELNASIHRDTFERLTSTYEVTWYGEAYIDAEAFKRIQPLFTSLIDALGHE